MINRQQGEDGPPGYIKLWRRMMVSDVWAFKAEHRIVWITILMKANFEKATRPLQHNGEPYRPDEGEWLTSVRDIAEWSGVSERSVRTALDRLENNDLIKVDSAHDGTLIEVVNWGHYQQNSKSGDTRVTNDRHTGDMPPTNGRHAGDKQVTNDRQHVKKDKEGHKKAQEDSARMRDGQPKDVIDHWNSKEPLQEIRDTEGSAKREAGNMLGLYDLNEVKTAIDHYAEVLAGGEYWYDTVHAPKKFFTDEKIGKFLNGTEQFIDGNSDGNMDEGYCPMMDRKPCDCTNPEPIYQDGELRYAVKNGSHELMPKGV